MLMRRATAEDVEAIARIHVAASRAAERGLLPDAALEAMSIEPRRRIWERIVTEPEHPVRVFVAEDEGGVVGFAASGPLRADKRTGELYAIYVDPDRQRRGHGSLLLDAAEEDLRARGCDDAVLWVLPANTRTIAFYEARGWRDDRAERVEDMHGTEVHERRYRKRLP